MTVMFGVCEIKPYDFYPYPGVGAVCATCSSGGCRCACDYDMHAEAEAINGSVFDIFSKEGKSCRYYEPDNETLLEEEMYNDPYGEGHDNDYD